MAEIVREGLIKSSVKGAGGFLGWGLSLLKILFSKKGFLGLTFILMIIFLIFTVIKSSVEAQESGDWSLPIFAVGNILFNADQNIDNELDNLREMKGTGAKIGFWKIMKLFGYFWFNLLWIIALWWIFFRVAMWFTSDSHRGLAFVLAFILLIGFQVLFKGFYLWKYSPSPLPYNEVLIKIIPFRGTAKFFVNYDLWLLPFIDWFMDSWLVRIFIKK